MKATWGDNALAWSETTVFLEGNHYFPHDSVRWEHLRKSDTKYTCPWKGTCDYYHIEIGDRVLEDGAWTYTHPNEAARHIAGRVAFAHSVDIQE